MSVNSLVPFIVLSGFSWVNDAPLEGRALGVRPEFRYDRCHVVGTSNSSSWSGYQNCELIDTPHRQQCTWHCDLTHGRTVRFVQCLCAAVVYSSTTQLVQQHNSSTLLVCRVSGPTNSGMYDTDVQRKSRARGYVGTWHFAIPPVAVLTVRFAHNYCSCTAAVPKNSMLLLPLPPLAVTRVFDMYVHLVV